MCSLVVPHAHTRIITWMEEVFTDNIIPSTPTSSVPVVEDGIPVIDGGEDVACLRQDDMVQDLAATLMAFEHGWALQHMLIHGPARFNEAVNTLRPTLLRMSLNAVTQELFGECLHGWTRCMSWSCMSCMTKR
jgi:hypothetical protein